MNPMLPVQLCFLHLTLLDILEILHQFRQEQNLTLLCKLYLEKDLEGHNSLIIS